MILLKLFRAEEPGREIERRALVEGELTLGRDPSAGWMIDDPTATLSRRHCTLVLRPDGLMLRDDSTNGVALDGQRPPSGELVPVPAGAMLMLGGFIIRIEEVATAGESTAAPEAADPAMAGRLLEAFCAGAGIDPSVFADEDPVGMMRRAGGVYRRMVEGMSELMTERTRAKVSLKLERTTVQAVDNNPFRWALPPRVAIDLLRPGQDGFLAGEAAVKSSFDDLIHHQSGLAAGSRAAMEQVLGSLSPDAISQLLKGRSFLNRPAALWGEYLQAHEQVRQALSGGEGPAGAAFREGYETAATARRA